MEIQESRIIGYNEDENGNHHVEQLKKNGWIVEWEHYVRCPADGYQFHVKLTKTYEEK